ncbi:MAG: type II toxin-antitoxin system VapC family toxin [Firmicutes bacterium]|nr:type II toxin-antitoxin system VapC family toxin [Bacillota bacterium]
MSRSEDVAGKFDGGSAGPRYLIDTCVFVDHLRGYVDAYEWFKRIANQTETPQLACSVITVAELFSGLSTEAPKSEEAVAKLLSQMDMIPVCRNIACSAGMYVRKWRVSHGVGPADALIAATACYLGVPLVTRDSRHYPMPEIKTYVPY